MRRLVRWLSGAGRSAEASPRADASGAAPLVPAVPAAAPEWLVVGLGNPGARYAGTRHNAGFEVVARVAAEAGAPFAADPAGAEVARGAVAGVPVALALPTTFMNRSGEAAVPLLTRFGLGPERLLVVVDDLALPVGALRLRARGRPAGHNGLASLDDALAEAFAADDGASVEYPRLRVGIGNSFAPGFQADYVLSRFDPDERAAAEAAFARAAEAVAAIVASGVDAAMATVNRRSPPPA